MLILSKINGLTLDRIIQVLEAQEVLLNNTATTDYEYCFSSDLMSDVLTLKSANTLLLTGLYNPQALRAAEIADINCVVFVRNKRIPEELLTLASELNISVLKTPFSLFKSSGILFQQGLKPLY